MAISTPYRKKLWRGAAGKCSYPGCDIRDNLEEGHSVADGPDGPRGDASWTKQQLDAYLNRILLCPNHHAEIDGDPVKWTVDRLLAMKANHESDVTGRLAGTAPAAPTIALGEPVEYVDEYADRTHLVPDPRYGNIGTTTRQTM